MDVIYNNDYQNMFPELTNEAGIESHSSSKMLPVIAVAIMSNALIVNQFAFDNNTKGSATSTFYINSFSNSDLKNTEWITVENTEGGAMKMSESNYLTDRDLENIKLLIGQSEKLMESKIDGVHQKIDTSEANLKEYIATQLMIQQGKISKKNYDISTRNIALAALIVPILWNIFERIMGWQ